jgi:coenzyme F420-0:L-glutamate ligase/coenzyme F420-1:gamma-L-glutamate ligase
MTSLEVVPLQGLPLIRAGDDPRPFWRCARSLAPVDGDVLVVAQKIVSKAEGRLVDLPPSPPAPRRRPRCRDRRDPRIVEVILGESVRVVRSRPTC